MPKNKSATQRYLVIDSLLQTGRRFSLEQIASACEIQTGKKPSHSTLKHDFTDLRKGLTFSNKAPIVCEQGYYFYSAKGFSLLDNNLDEDEISLLNKIIVLLKDKGHAETAKALIKVIAKLRRMDSI